MSKSKLTWLVPTLTVVILAVLKVHGAFEAKPQDAEPYHQRVREIFTTFPYTVGNWVGVEAGLDAGTIALLRPNVAISRTYKNVTTGTFAQYMLIHCKNAISMVGHYPDVCYPNQGWEQRKVEAVDFEIDGTIIPTTEYLFVFNGKTLNSNSILVYDLMILPSGEIVRDSTGLNATAKSYRRHFYGVAQLQIVFNADVSPVERHQAVTEFLRASRPLMDVIKAGVSR